MQIQITKNLAGAEDILLDATIETVEQTRGDTTKTLTTLNASTIPVVGKFGSSTFVSVKDYIDAVQTSINSDLVLSNVSNANMQHIIRNSANWLYANTGLVTGAICIEITDLYTHSLSGEMEVVITQNSALDEEVSNYVVRIAGNWRANETWHNTKAILAHCTGDETLNIRYMRNTSTGKVYISIGDITSEWKYPRVAIMTMQVNGALVGYTPDALISIITSYYNIASTITVQSLNNLLSGKLGINDTRFALTTSTTNGFKTDSTSHTLVDMLWDNDTRLLSLNRLDENSYEIFCNGVLYTIDDDYDYGIPDVDGLHYVYFVDGVGTVSQAFSTDLLLKHALIAMVYWNSSMAKEDDFGDPYVESAGLAQYEAHGSAISGWEHLQRHLRDGALYQDGLNIDLTIGTGTLNLDCQIGMTVGHTQDEDLTHSYLNRVEEDTILKLYKMGTNKWEFDERKSSIVYNYSVGHRPVYNKLVGTTYSIEEMPDDTYMLVHIYSFPRVKDVDGLVAGPTVICVLGTGYYNTIEDATAEAITEPNLEPLPAPEYKLLYTLVVHASNAYINDYKARIVPLADGALYSDWRSVTNGRQSSNLPVSTSATNISVDFVPVSYTPAESNVEEHLKAIADTIGYKKMIVQDQKPYNVAGGSSIAGINPRTLNTVVFNNIIGASLGSNNITLPAGEYEIEVSAPQYGTSAMASRVLVKNIGTSAYIVVGRRESSNSGSRCTLKGIITLTAPTVLGIYHEIQYAYSTSGLGGFGALTNTSPSIYTTVEITQLKIGA